MCDNTKPWCLLLRGFVYGVWISMGFHPDIANAGHGQFCSRCVESGTVPGFRLTYIACLSLKQSWALGRHGKLGRMRRAVAMPWKASGR